jgi:hypothetical protein
MTQHIVIRRQEYVAGTADKPEVSTTSSGSTA